MEFINNPQKRDRNKMNNYKIEFFSKCPVNNIRIHYKLTVKTKNIIMVEQLVDFVSHLDNCLHEDIADKLFNNFGGNQTLEANHHSVFLWTERS